MLGVGVDMLSLIVNRDNGALLVSLVLIGVTLAVYNSRTLVASFRRSTATASRETFKVNTANANKDRILGDWTPVDYQHPPIQPSAERLADIKPVPYRPFKWGPYHVTMGLKSMPLNDWIELDRDFEKYHRVKSHRMQLRGEKAVQVLSDSANPDVVRGGDFAAVELVHQLSEFLSRRYPADYTVRRHPPQSQPSTAHPREPAQARDRVTPSSESSISGFTDWGWDGLPPIRYIKIVALDIEYEIPLSVDAPVSETINVHETGEKGCLSRCTTMAGKRAMEIAGLLVQDDLALMVEGNDGRYYFQAGSICVPGFWRMQDKLGMPLDDIHLSGNVPQYKERLQPSLDRFFRKLSVDKPVTRINYFVQTRRRDGEHEARGEGEIDPDELGWATSSLGDEDDFENGTHATAKPKNGVGDDTPVDWMRLRCERQTLRRLARSGAVLFTIRVYINPMEELAREIGVPGRMASALRSWPADVAGYKGKNRGGWWEPLLRFLDAEHEAQVSAGVGMMADGSETK